MQIIGYFSRVFNKKYQPKGYLNLLDSKVERPLGNSKDP